MFRMSEIGILRQRPETSVTATPLERECAFFLVTRHAERSVSYHRAPQMLRMLRNAGRLAGLPLVESAQRVRGTRDGSPRTVARRSCDLPLSTDHGGQSSGLIVGDEQNSYYLKSSSVAHPVLSPASLDPARMLNTSAL